MIIVAALRACMEDCWRADVKARGRSDLRRSGVWVFGSRGKTVAEVDDFLLGNADAADQLARFGDPGDS